MMLVKNTKRNYVEIAIVVATLMVFEAVFFRNVLFSDQLIGNSGDGRLCTYLAEHWYRVFLGLDSVRDLNMFYPAENVLGYTDMFLGIGVIHSFFRIVGVNLYTAFKLSIIAIHVFGTFSFFFLMRNTIKVRTVWALMGTVAFSFSNAYAVNIYHPQLVCLSVVPFFIICLLKFFRDFSCSTKRHIWAVFAILSYLFIIYTAWYIAFFVALFCLICIVVFFLRSLISDRNALKEIAQKAWSAKGSLVVYLLLLGILLVPFALVYFPVLQSSDGGYGFAEASVYLPEPIDIINISKNNLLLGDFIAQLGIDPREGASSEVRGGFSPIYLVFAAIVIWMYFKRVYKQENINVKRTYVVVLISIILSILLLLKLSGTSISLWYLVCQYIPGGSSIRATGRVMFFLSLPLAILFSYAGDRSINSGKTAGRRIILGGMGVLLLLLINIYIYPQYPEWNAAVEQERLNHVAEPPEDCEVFYLADGWSKGQATDGAVAQLDAVEIAYKYNIKTLNGYSGQTPEGWSLWNADPAAYQTSVMQWAEQNQIETLYKYSYHTNTWEKVLPE